MKPAYGFGPSSSLFPAPFGVLFALLGALLTAPDAGAGMDLAATDWAQPPVGCIEELVPRDPAEPCPDLTQVKDPIKELPDSLTPEEVALWTGPKKRALLICRSREILRREALAPGKLDPAWVEASFMRIEGLKDTEAKVSALYEAAAEAQMPPQVLLGALLQESMFADLGITSDGGNYSCGISQLNVLEWCSWVVRQRPALQQELGWPAGSSAEWCRDPLLKTDYVKPFHAIALTRLDKLPGYRLGPEHFRDITLAEVRPQLPTAEPHIQQRRFQMIQSFTQNCSSFVHAIPAKAQVLRLLYDYQVPAGLKAIQVYGGQETFQRRCQQEPNTRSYPLSSAWLLADAIYNAGERVVDTVAHYRRMTERSVLLPETWEPVTPQELIRALYGAGKYNPTTDKLDYRTLSGKAASMTWMKTCVVQRHVARVVQYSTLPGFELVRSLEDSTGCRKSVYDSNGKLVKSAVPLERQRASGRMEKADRLAGLE